MSLSSFLGLILSPSCVYAHARTEDMIQLDILMAIKEWNHFLSLSLSIWTLILKISVRTKMLIVLHNNNILLQTLLFKIIDSRDNAVRVHEKVVFCPVTVNIFYGQQFPTTRLPR